jgi:Mn-dependent DtxR family transcriptional regulator
MTCTHPSCYPKTLPTYQKILLLIYKNQMSTKELAILHETCYNNVRNIVKRLQAAGLVERVKVGGVLQIRLTEAGREVVEGME